MGGELPTGIPAGTQPDGEGGLGAALQAAGRRARGPAAGLLPDPAGLRDRPGAHRPARQLHRSRGHLARTGGDGRPADPPQPPRERMGARLRGARREGPAEMAGPQGEQALAAEPQGSRAVGRDRAAGRARGRCHKLRDYGAHKFEPVSPDATLELSIPMGEDRLRFDLLVEFDLARSACGRARIAYGATTG